MFKLNFFDINDIENFFIKQTNFDMYIFNS